MDIILNNLEIVVFLGVVLASWLKNRADAKREAEDERRAREEMAGGDLPFDPPSAWPRPDQQPFPASPPLERRPATPPPLQPQPSEPPAAAPIWPPQPGLIEIHGAQQHEVLHRQQQMQEKLAELGQIKEQTQQAAMSARAKRLEAARAARDAQASRRRATDAQATTLRGMLQSPAHSRRAIVLREILGPPVALK